MTRAARAAEIACDSRKQKLYRLNQPLDVPFKISDDHPHHFYKGVPPPGVIGTVPTPPPPSRVVPTHIAPVKLVNCKG